jgi:hypothetical protein
MATSRTPKFFIQKNNQQKEKFPEVNLQDSKTHFATLRRFSNSERQDMQQRITERLLKLNENLRRENGELVLANQDLLRLLKDANNKVEQLWTLLSEIAADADKNDQPNFKM